MSDHHQYVSVVDDYEDEIAETQENTSSTLRRRAGRKLDVFMHSPSFRALRKRVSMTAADNASTGGGMEPTYQKFAQGILYGLINSILTIPCMYGYAAIIFHGDAFADSLPSLSKLVLFSSMVHQCVFTVMSSLDFSIGQVQDAGLVFLATITKDISEKLENDQQEAIIPTTLVTLALSTALLGLVVLVIGKLRLANLVAFLPMPVIGGYLGFIGFFCLEAGVGLSTGLKMDRASDFVLVDNWHSVLLMTPALVGGGLLAYISRHAKHWLALPTALMLMPVMFYLALAVSGMSMQDARDAGWVSPKVPDVRLWEEVPSLYNFELVDWSIVPKQAFTWVSMTLMVSFSSCLDVVAIEMDMGKQLDINHELCTVGISNLISGLFGGYTGSYIFSQTIFTYRTHTNTRLVGIVVIVCELALSILPMDVMQFVPKFFFAATLIFIAVDLLYEWLILVRPKVSGKEYMILLVTFVFTVATNELLQGIALGVALSFINFIFCYASVEHVKSETNHVSNTMRSFKQRRLLSVHQPMEVATLSLHGYLFFGSTNQIVAKVRRLISGPPPVTQASGYGKDGGAIRRVLTVPSQLLKRAFRHEDEEQSTRDDNDDEVVVPTTSTRLLGRSINGAQTNSGDAGNQSLPSKQGGEYSAISNRTLNSLIGNTEGSDSAVDTDALDLEAHGQFLYASSPIHPFWSDVARLGKRFLVLDFSRVTGIDVTAISTGLMRVKQLAMNNNICLVFVAVRLDFQKLLVANHLMSSNNEDETLFLFEDINDGLDWVESQILADRGSRKLFADEDNIKIPDIPYAWNLDGSDGEVVESVQMVHGATEFLQRILFDFFGWHLQPDLEHTFCSFFGLKRFRRGDCVFNSHDEASEFFIVMRGEVVLFFPGLDSQGSTPNKFRMIGEQGQRGRRVPSGTLLQRCRHGSIFGDVHFCLEGRRQFAAVATEETALFFLTRERYEKMALESPTMALGLQHCLSKSQSLEIGCQYSKMEIQRPWKKN